MRKIIFLTIVIVSILIWGSRAIEAYDRVDYEIVRTHTLQDGVTIAVHYNQIDLAAHHSNPYSYVNRILECSVEAYNEIVYGQGFNAPGFTFANPDKDYCYDEDKTIDIYIVANFQNAPCYDIAKGKGQDYDAIVLFPVDYKEYLYNCGFGDISDSKVTERIKGTIFHEMFHIITYSYNKNIEPWYRLHKGASRYQGGDWYVEGLARYFETVAGSYDNFFSEGFIKKESDKTIISQKGANFLMEHPYQSLEKSRYDWSLFWAYIHKTYGMKKIEELSRKLRFISKGDMKKELPTIVSAVLEEEFEDVLKDFAVAMYFKLFSPNIKKGLNDLKTTSLDDFSDIHEKEVGPWASNFITLDLDKQNMPQTISFKKLSKDKTLRMTVIAGLKNDKMVQVRSITLDREKTICKMNLADMKSIGVSRLVLIITNACPDSDTKYRILNY